MIRAILSAAAMLACCSVSFADEVPAMQVGQQAPDFTATGLDGKTFRLSDKLKPGRKNIALMFSRANW